MKYKITVEVEKLGPDSDYDRWQDIYMQQGESDQGIVYTVVQAVNNYQPYKDKALKDIKKEIKEQESGK